MNPTLTKPEKLSAARGGQYWLWLLRISIALSCVLYGWGFFSEDFFPLLLAVPFAAFYFLLLLAVRDRPQETSLVLTQLISAIGILISFFFLFSTFKGGPVVPLALPLLFSQCLAEVSAKNTSRLLKGSDVRQLRAMPQIGVYGVLGFVLLAGGVRVIQGQQNTKKRARESREAVAAMRRINVCAVSYARAHPEQGYPPNLRSLGPEGSRCLDDQLARGYLGEYTFRYYGHQRSYGVSAVPSRKYELEWESFYSDQSGVVRHQRGFPTGQSPPLE